MKIAVITDDGQTISQHFGRAQHYLIVTVEDGAITGRELRDKPGHRQFAHEPHDHDHGHDHGHDHEHDHEHGHGQGHGFGTHADRKHNLMVEPLHDCEALLVRGMGRGAYLAVTNAGVRPVVTTIASAEEAVQAYIDGQIEDHPEKLH
jgi:predicted Fe-Mo cluster-binding NifX family protein